MKISLNPTITCFVLLTLSIMGGCSGKTHVTSLSEVGGSDRIIIGKFELVPPLGKNEQKLGTGVEKMRQALTFNIADKELTPYQAKMYSARYGAIVKFGETFFIKEKQYSPLYLSDAYTYLNRYTQTRGNTIYQYEDLLEFPGKIKYSFDKNAKAVYLGTIRYYRNSKNKIINVKYINEYTATNREFKRKFGSGVTLVKARRQAIK